MIRCLLIVLLFAGSFQSLSAQSPALRAADVHFQAKQWSAAEQAYRAILATDSTSPMAWYRLGRVYLEGMNDGARAQRHFEAALRHGFVPASFAQFGIARAQVLRGQPDEAVESLAQMAAAGFAQHQNVSADTILNRLSGNQKYQIALATMKRNAEPCEHTPEFRQLDFWIGTWNVFSPQGTQIGTNRIEKLLRGCLIQENWTDGFGREGKSINFYDQQRKTWRQVWVADGSSVTDYTAGSFSGNAMTFRASNVGANGKTIQHKLTFTRVHADTVTQVFDQSADDGKTWSTTWKGTYIRVK